MPDEPLAPGTKLGAFVLGPRVGQGGMGAVYHARNRITGEVRAVKVVRPEHAANDDLVGRFMREMRLASAIEHPNIVRVYEPSMEGDTLILPMEFIDGVTLRAHLRTSAGTPRRLTSDEALDLVIPICDGVGALHARGIVHRDLKPPNVMLARGLDGVPVPKVLDLGAALDLSGGDEATRTGLLIGTVMYMPFEQASGRRDLDARVDVYALGVILYEMLTGRRPYDGADTQSVLASVIQRLPFPEVRTLAPEIEPALADLIDQTVSHDRGARPADARALAAALRVIQRADRAGGPLTPEADSSQVIVEHSVPPTARASLAVRIAAGAISVIAAALVVASIVKGAPATSTSPGRVRPDRFVVPVATPVLRVVPVVQQLAPTPAEVVPARAPPPASDSVGADASVRPAVSPRPATRRCRPRPNVICPPRGTF